MYSSIIDFYAENKPLFEVLGTERTIFFSPAKVTVKCMEQNRDITNLDTKRNPRYNEHNPEAQT